MSVCYCCWQHVPCVSVSVLTCCSPHRMLLHVVDTLYCPRSHSFPPTPPPSPRSRLSTQLLDLHGKQSYLLCDITKAYDRLVSMEMLEGFSAEALEGRVEVLNVLKESALLQDGRVQPDRGLDLPTRLMPSALALLAQVCVGRRRKKWRRARGGLFGRCTLQLKRHTGQAQQRPQQHPVLIVLLCLLLVVHVL